MQTSARNVIPGTVIAVKAGAVTSEVTLQIAPGVAITSVVPPGSDLHLRLRAGMRAYAVVKASSVLVATG